MTSTAFQSKFTATTLQNWWTQSGWSGIKAWAPRDKERNLVHQTVEIPAATEGTTIPLLLKFTPGGKVDEIGEKATRKNLIPSHILAMINLTPIKNVKSSLEILPIRYQRH